MFSLRVYVFLFFSLICGSLPAAELQDVSPEQLHNVYNLQQGMQGWIKSGRKTEKQKPCREIALCKNN